MIYFIRAMQSGAIKIGTSNDPKRRLESMQTGSPEPLQIIAVLPGQADEERRLHQKFAKFRIHGEWFKGEPELIQGIALLVQAPIADVIENVHADYWIIRGSVVNGSNAGHEELFCVCRDGKLFPDPNEMESAFPHGYTFYEIESILNVSHLPEHWPKDLEVLRKPLTSREFLSWVANLDELDRPFLPVPGSEPIEIDADEVRVNRLAESPETVPKLIRMPDTLPAWARPSNS